MALQGMLFVKGERTECSIPNDSKEHLLGYCSVRVEALER